ncbi:MAG: hypothetical protein AAGI90_05885 [Chlamydiota bacterium]
MNLIPSCFRCCRRRHVNEHISTDNLGAPGDRPANHRVDRIPTPAGQSFIGNSFTQLASLFYRTSIAKEPEIDLKNKFQYFGSNRRREFDPDRFTKTIQEILEQQNKADVPVASDGERTTVLENKKEQLWAKKAKLEKEKRELEEQSKELKIQKQEALKRAIPLIQEAIESLEEHLKLLERAASLRTQQIEKVKKAAQLNREITGAHPSINQEIEKIEGNAQLQKDMIKNLEEEFSSGVSIGELKRRVQSKQSVESLDPQLKQCWQTYRKIVRRTQELKADLVRSEAEINAFKARNIKNPDRKTL